MSSRNVSGIALPGATIVLLSALCLILPLLIIVLAPFTTEAPNWSHVLEHTLGDQFLNSLLLVFGSSALSIIFGTVSAWLVSAYEFPGRRVFKWLLVLPLAIPTYIAAYIYGDLLGPTGKWSLALGEQTGLFPDIMNILGLMFVFSAVLYPYVYLSARALFSYGSGDLIGVARTLGASECKLFFKVGLPLAMPAVLGGALLVSMEVLNDYGAVQYFGIPTLTSGVFRSWHNMGDIGTALRISSALLLLALVLRALERANRRKHKYAFTPKPLNTLKLTRRNAWLAFAFCMIPAVLGLIMPFAKMLTDLLTGSTLSKALNYDLLPALLNTLGVGSAACILTLVLGIIFTYSARFASSSLIKGFTQLASLGYVVPGAVIAVGVMHLAGILDRNIGIVMLIGSFALLVYAMCVRFLAIAQESILSGTESIDDSLAESARILGKNAFGAFRKVELPLLKKSLAAAALLVFVEVVKELPLTLILKPFNFETLATQAYRFAGIELLEESSVAACLILLCSLLPILLFERGIFARR